MNSKVKKMVGSSLMLTVVGVGALLYSGVAQGLYRYIGSDLRATGKVQQVGTSSFELVTSGSTWPLTIVTDSATDYSNGYGKLSDVKVGDEVRVVAERMSGDFAGIEVAKQSQPGTYGNTTCDSFVISTATFERPVNNTIYVVKDNVGVRINIDGDTKVEGGTMSDVVPGTQVVISGYDCRTTGELTAQTIQIVKNDALTACNSYGSNAIVVRNYSVLLANDEPSAMSPMLEAAIPKGRYNVFGVSHDNHATSPWDTQPYEQWNAAGYDAAGKRVFQTKNTNDLPNGVDFNVTQIGNKLFVRDDTASVRLYHAVKPGTQGYQSIYPVCVVFQPTSVSVGNGNNQGDDGSQREDNDGRNEDQLGGGR